MGSIYRYSFTVGKDTDIFPVYLSIAEGGPAMTLALSYKLLPRPTTRGDEAWFACDAVIECDLWGVTLLLLDCF